MLFFLAQLEGNCTSLLSQYLWFSILVLASVMLSFVVFRYKWDNNEKHMKPETGLLQLRQGLKVFANLRPASVLPQVTNGL